MIQSNDTMTKWYPLLLNFHRNPMKLHNNESNKRNQKKLFKKKTNVWQR